MKINLPSLMLMKRLFVHVSCRAMLIIILAFFCLMIKSSPLSAQTSVQSTFNVLNTTPQYINIVPDQFSGKCVTIANASMQEYAKSVQMSCNGEDHQQFSVEYIGTQFRLRAKHSDLCLGVVDASMVKGEAVVQMPCDSNDYQLWSSNAIGDSSSLILAHSGQCMDVFGDDKSDGVSIIQWPCHGHFNQQFVSTGLTNFCISPVIEADVPPPTLPNVEADVSPPTLANVVVDAPQSRLPSVVVEDMPQPIPQVVEAYVPPPGEVKEYISIVLDNFSGKCVAIANASTKAYAEAIQMSCNGEDHQQFSVEQVGTHLRLQAKHSDFCLGVADGSEQRGVAIVQMRCDSNNNLWSSNASKIDSPLVLAHSGQCMDVAGDNQADGTAINQWKCNGGTNQQFTLRYFEVSEPPVVGASSIWTGPFDMPLVAVAAANLPDGRILTWSAYNRFQFGGDHGRTYTAIFDPATGLSTEALIQNTQHDMFCPGLNMLSDGRVFVNGGSSNEQTSIYNPSSNSWQASSQMNIGRGYQANTILANGSVLTIGGSWSGGLGSKNAEVWTEGAGWQLLPGLSVESLLTDDQQGIYRSDNHMWLLSAANGKVFHAGPSKNMHWLDTSGYGSITSEGTRGNSDDAMNGNAVLYDIGKILVVGGAVDYEDSLATNQAYIIDINGGEGNVTTRQIESMSFRRAFHNSVVLPSGEVVVIGGQAVPIPFSDDQSVFAAEIWNPDTEEFTVLSDMAVPRNYHSIAVLLADGRVMAAGSGLCGSCATNHADAEILTPPYLLNDDSSLRDRLLIDSVAAQLTYGSIARVSISNGTAVGFVLIRASSTTHSVNNDQRRVPVNFTSVGNGNYDISIPSNSGLVTPGNYFLFAMDGDGTPSVAKTINIK